MRLCDLDEIKIRVKRQYEDCHGYSGNKKAIYREAILAVRSILHSAKAIDAVPVVRCRECKHHRDKNEQEQQYLVEDILICTSPDATDDCWNAVWPDHFCSYGKRKEGADNG